jgi:hypothetical protein
MNGSRMSDTFFLRWEDVSKDRISYKMMKTNKEMNVSKCKYLPYLE